MLTNRKSNDSTGGLVVRLLSNLDKIIGCAFGVGRVGAKRQSIKLTRLRSFKEQVPALQAPAAARSLLMFPGDCFEP